MSGRDMEELAALGYTAVLHTFSENDLAYYRGTMGEIVERSRIAPASRCRRARGGSAARSAARPRAGSSLDHPEASQVAADGTRLPAACPNQPAYRDVLPRVGRRRARGGGRPRLLGRAALARADLPLRRLRRRRDVAGRLPRRAGRARRRPRRPQHGVPAAGARATGMRWRRCPGLEVLATDPYWKSFRQPAEPFVREYAERVAATARAHGVGAQLWVPSFGSDRRRHPRFDRRRRRRSRRPVSTTSGRGRSRRAGT